MRAVPRVALIAGMIFPVGCGSPPPPTVDAAPREAAREFFDAIVRKDWPAAYDRLDPAAKSRLTADEFAKRADGFRRALGFEPAEVHPDTCSVTGDDAAVRVFLAAAPGKGKHRSREALQLKQRDGKWWVLLPTKLAGKNGS